MHSREVLQEYNTSRMERLCCPSPGKGLRIFSFSSTRTHSRRSQDTTGESGGSKRITHAGKSNPSLISHFWHVDARETEKMAEEPKMREINTQASLQGRGNSPKVTGSLPPGHDGRIPEATKAIIRNPSPNRYHTNTIVVLSCRYFRSQSMAAYPETAAQIVAMIRLPTPSENTEGWIFIIS